MQQCGGKEMNFYQEIVALRVTKKRELLPLRVGNTSRRYRKREQYNVLKLLKLMRLAKDIFLIKESLNAK